MTFDEVLEQVRELLQSKGRVAYRALKRRFELDDEYLEDLKAELINAEHVARDEDGKVLVWVGASLVSSFQLSAPSPQTLDPRLQPRASPRGAREGERRQLTVMFCDLVGSTALSTKLDPEELREVVRGYQQTSAAVIERFGGHIAQYLGDGLLVYFGYPVAHEDDAARAVRAALAIITTLQKQVPSPLVGEGQGEGATAQARKLQVRIGIHTGPVVVGEMGGGAKREQLALGETPNIAARVQGQAEPDTVVISQATHRLVEGLFACEDYGQPALKGISTPLTLYRVVKEGEAQSRFEVAVGMGLTPLVGRGEELSVLQRRWTQVKDGAGQVVLVSGEPGIGKSRLVQELKEHVSAEGATRIEFHCSPYHQNSALYPIIDHLQRLLQFAREDAPTTKLGKLQHTLSHYRFPQADTFPLLAVLLSLPHPEGYPPITVSPQKQKEKTQAALVAWIVEEAEQNTVYNAWEDVHWADPSTLEVLTLLLDQVPTTRLLAVLTFRPEFIPPWGNRSHLSQMTLSRLGRSQVEAMVEQVTRGKALPVEVVQQIVAKTDGVPLFVEELTKTVMESGLVREEGDRYVGAHGGAPISSLTIPATLQDSLMARLDRLAPVKEIAQLGATLGREFSYELIHAVSSLGEGSLQQGLRQLVEAELLYQRGLPPQATYLFKHALIQDTAYQSLLKSKRQQYHQRIAQVLAEQFPDTKETQPELVAHHYTEAGLITQAIPHWQRAGQRASQRSAYVEAISHFTKGLELLDTLPDTPERSQHELRLQLALGTPLQATRGWGSRETARIYTRARELCRELGETPQLFSVLWGLGALHLLHAEYQTARELMEQQLRLAQSTQDSTMLVNAHHAMGQVMYFLGEFLLARKHFEQGLVLYDPQKHSPQISGFVQDPGMTCLSVGSWLSWFLGYPDQALEKSQEAITLGHGLSHPFSLAYALSCSTLFYQLLREARLTQEQAERVITVSTEQGIPVFLELATQLRTWALTEQGQEEEIRRKEQERITGRIIRAKMYRSYFLALLVEACGKRGRVEEGLAVLVEALAWVDKTGERFYEAELYRLKGTLTLQSKVQGPKSKVEEAEECFWKAIEIARKQQAKSLELRAAMSLAKLWQQQNKKAEAHQMLAEIYGWFTEGFDTKDLQEAKGLLEELQH